MKHFYTNSYRFFNRLILRMVPFAFIFMADYASAESVLVKNVHVIDSRAKVSRLQNVLIVDGDIRTITRKHVEAESYLDGEKGFLIPGLIDTHVHLSDIPGFITSEAGDDEIAAEAHLQIPRSYLYFGFTTLLDLAGDAALSKRWKQFDVAPEVYFCTALPIPNGYPLAWLPEDHRHHSPLAKNVLWDERQPNALPLEFTAKNHAPTTLIENAKADGASCIKTFYEEGFGPLKNLPVPSEKLMNEVVDVAHKENLNVFLHGNSSQAHAFGMKTGVDVMAHGIWHAEEKFDQKILLWAKKIKSSGLGIQPTLQVVYGEQELFNPDFLDRNDVKAVIPGRLLQWYKSDAGQWMHRELSGSVLKDSHKPSPIDQYRNVQQSFKNVIALAAETTRALDQANAKLLFGSDTPSGPFYTQFPGLNGRMEIDRWHELGIGLTKLFMALTIDNAKLLKKDAEIGSVTVGKRANLLLLSKNPLLDIAAYDSIDVIFLNGKVIKRESLRASQLK
ncbi:MAG: hypothetical protein EOO07_14695 [Chitinophagaceae bacterium]|nr:MAG: hypothetical protein EOO07_14695 [Chitinophagaceae bacterium]